jgi:hypothetical protein
VQAKKKFTQKQLHKLKNQMKDSSPPTAVPPVACCPCSLFAFIPVLACCLCSVKNCFYFLPSFNLQLIGSQSCALSRATTTTMIMVRARARANAIARVALARAMLMRADEDDSNKRVAQTRVP